MKTTTKIHHLPLASIEESPANVRRTSWGDLDGLARTIAAQGQLQPGVVRELSPGRYGLVVGARRLRACRIAGLDTFDAIVQPLDDASAHDARLAENVERESLSHIEEAEGFRVAIEEHDRSIEEIAARVGRDRRYVTQRLALLDLVPELRRWLDGDRLAQDGALLLAQHASSTQQRAAARLRVAAMQPGRRITRDDVRRAIADCLVDLSDPGFDLDDAALVPAAGACGACPKRTGAQGALFGVLERDACLDPDCHAAKLAASWDAKSARARDAGLVVLESEDETRAAYQAGGAYWCVDDPAYYLDADGEPTDVAGEQVEDDDGEATWVPNRAVPWRALLGADFAPALGRGPGGRSVELVSREAAREALARAKVQIDAPRDGGSGADPAPGAAEQYEAERRKKEREAAKKRREKDAIRDDGIRRAKHALVAAIESGGNSAEVLRALLLAEIAGMHEQTLGEVCRDRGWKLEDRATGETLRAKESITRESIDMNEAQLSGLLAEVIVSRSIPAYRTGANGTGFELVARAKGIDVKHHLREAEKAAKDQKRGVRRGRKARQMEMGGADAAEE